MDYQNNDVINNILKYFNKLDLLMFSHINKRFIEHSRKYLLKYKNINFVVDKIYMPKRIKFTVNAAFEGYLDVLIYLRNNGCQWDQFTCAYAALMGHLELLMYLRKNKCKWNHWTCLYAARGGHFELLKWARENECNWYRNVCLESARQNNHIKMVQWINNN
jgi:hypothetical protein